MNAGFLAPALDDQTRGRWPRWIALLKLAKVPFWFVWVTPLIYGFLASARITAASHVGWFLLTLLGTCLLEATNCIHNALVDQEEDRLNQPNRATLIASVGEPALWTIVRAGYATCLLGVGLICRYVSLWVALLMLAGGLAAPLYNWGPRFKRRPVLAEGAIAWAASCAYLIGWTWNGARGGVSPVVWVLTYFFFATFFTKDLPDVHGDEKVKAPGLFSIRQRALRTVLLFSLYVSPYLLVVGLISFGLLPFRFLLMGALGMLGLGIPVLVEHADTLLTQIVTCELAYLYVHLFLVMLFILEIPTRQAGVIGAGLLVGRAVSVYLGLSPRFVEPEFGWSRAIRALRSQSMPLAGPPTAPSCSMQKNPEHSKSLDSPSDWKL